MTLPCERSRAVEATREFLVSICTGKSQDFRSFRKLREEARRLLKHYPQPHDLVRAARGCPEVFGSREVWWSESNRPKSDNYA